MKQSGLVRKVPKTKQIFNLQRIYESQAAEKSRQRGFDSYNDYLQHDQENVDCAFFNVICAEQPQSPRSPKPSVCVEREVEFRVLEDTTKRKGISVRSEFTSSAIMMHGSMAFSQSPRESRQTKSGQTTNLIRLPARLESQNILRPANRNTARRQH